MIAANHVLARNLVNDAPALMTAQAGLASLQRKDTTQSIFQVVEFVLGGQPERAAQENEGTSRAFKEVQETVNAFGDSVFLNDAIYENYLTMFRYYDDDLEKAACLMDCLSLNQKHEDVTMLTQDYSLRSFAYLPSACFRVRSQRQHDFNAKFAYPKIHRSCLNEKKRNAHTLETFMDLKTKMASFKPGGGKKDEA